MPDRPNIFLVQADQHRHDCVGAHDLLETPTLDSLAADGATFSNAYTPIPICSPERACLMTGQWPSRHGVRNLVGQPGGGPLPEDRPTFSEVLADAGYATRYVGRWHLGHEEAGGPENFGFDEWVPNDRYADWRAERGLPERPGPNAEEGWFGTTDEGIEPAESRLAWAADRTIEHLEDLTDEEPFLLRWDTFEPHLPNVVPEPYASLYDPDDIEPWGSFPDDLDGKPWIQRQLRRTWRLEDMDWEDWAPTVARYLGELTLLDHQLGRVLDRLDELGLAGDTLVVYTADHGDMCGSHGMIDKHYNMYDDIVQVPLLARWPGEIDPGAEVDGFVTHALDLAATFVDVAGEDVPGEFQGDSLAPLWNGAEGRDDVYAVYYGCQMGLFTSRMVRTDNHKYVWNLTAPDELYDLEVDSWELENVVDDPAYADVRERLQERALEWARATDDDLRNPWTLGQLDDDEWPW